MASKTPKMTKIFFMILFLSPFCCLSNSATDIHMNTFVGVCCFFLTEWKRLTQTASKSWSAVVFSKSRISLWASSLPPLQDLPSYLCHQWREARECPWEEASCSMKCTASSIGNWLKSWAIPSLRSICILVCWVESNFNQQQSDRAQLACSKDMSVTSMPGINGF